jgi:hypothetical protein
MRVMRGMGKLRVMAEIDVKHETATDIGVSLSSGDEASGGKVLFERQGINADRQEWLE